MARSPSFTPTRDNRKGLWFVSIPPHLSATGKRKREYFADPQQAKDRAEALQKARHSTLKAIGRTQPEFIRMAVEYDELFRDVYDFPGGLKEACDHLMKTLDREHQSYFFKDLLEAYRIARSPNWGNHSHGKWTWFTAAVDSLAPLRVVQLRPAFLAEWIEKQMEVKGWNAQTFNDVHTLLSGVWKHAVDLHLATENPMTAVGRRKVRSREKPVYTVDEVRRVMETAWKHDHELVPYYALAIFAGLRPDLTSEIAALTWDDVNFEEGWIRVGRSFENKTATRRFVPMEDNLRKWLEPWRNRTGPVVPGNLRNRRQWLTKGRYGSPPGTPSSEWKELVPNGPKFRDITRHTYGSYLEAKYRDRNVVKENMGHADFRTYEQHYRNARSPQEAEQFWNILPPA